MRMDDKPNIPLRQRSNHSARTIFQTTPDQNLPSPPPPRSLYIHIPFCFHKCHYCDFYSFVDTRDQQPAFTDRLCRELASLGKHSPEPLETIFVGGGTPTLLAHEHWRSLLQTLDDAFDMSRIRLRGEFSVECNPETASPELFDTLVAGGVNRISIGAQSFDPSMLKVLERWHEPDNVEKAVALARAAGIDRVSVDLIFAIPGQTIEGWLQDLDRALAMGTEHLSCYGLTYEPNTAMTKRLERGDFSPMDEDLEADLFVATGEHLARAGLDRYEVSNFARPGAECRHNLAYWRQEPWLAAGPSASGHVAGWRWKNIPRLGDYLDFDDEGYAPIRDIEPPDPLRAVAEKIMTGLRLREGLDARSLIAQAQDALPGAGDRLRHEFAIHASAGRVTTQNGRWVLTPSGLLFADGIAGDLMGVLDA